MISIKPEANSYFSPNRTSADMEVVSESADLQSTMPVILPTDAGSGSGASCRSVAGGVECVATCWDTGVSQRLKIQSPVITVAVKYATAQPEE